jgi:hypothetical protein
MPVTGLARRFTKTKPTKSWAITVLVARLIETLCITVFFLGVILRFMVLVATSTIHHAISATDALLFLALEIPMTGAVVLIGAVVVGYVKRAILDKLGQPPLQRFKKGKF